MMSDSAYLAAVIALLMGLGSSAMALPRATDRGSLQVTETPQEIAIGAYEWIARHRKNAGGCLSSVHLKVGRELLGAQAGARVNRLCERHDPGPRIEIETPDDRTVLVTVRGRLCSADGSPSPIAFTHVYRYRREYLRHEVTLSAAGAVEGVTEVVPFEAVGVDFRRFAACPSVEHDTGWHKWGAAQRGAVQEADGVLWEDTMPARHLCLFSGGYGGIDWFPSSEGEAWRWTQGPDTGSWRIEVVDGEPRISAAVYLQDDPITVTGSTTWSFYTSWPCTTESFQPDPECAVVAPEYESLTVEDVVRYAEEGWDMIMPVCGWEIRRWRETPREEYTFLQHDNDVSLRDAVVRAHELGMLLVAYINLPATCVTDEEYSRVGSEMRRTWSGSPDEEQWALTDKGFRYGHGCYCSEHFRRAVYPFIEQAWRSQDFDGLYYDFADVEHCTNAAHCGGVHVWSDGLFEILDWTRELMGSGKILFLHVGTEVHPCYATENYADYVIFYENYGWASWMGRIHEPEEFYDCFTAANNTGVSLATNVYAKREVSAGELWTKMALWGDHSPFAGDPRFYRSVDSDGKEARRWEWSRRVRLRFEPYDLSTYEFVPLVRQPASVSDGGWASAWEKDGEVLLLVANLSDEAKRFTVTPHAVLMASMGDAPLEITVGDRPPRRILPADRGDMVLEVDVPAQDFTLTRIVRTAERG